MNPVKSRSAQCMCKWWISFFPSPWRKANPNQNATRMTATDWPQFPGLKAVEIGDIQIRSITPSKVTFFCPETKNPVRTIGVWTDKGRELLNGQLHQSGHFAQLEQQIDASLAV